MRKLITPFGYALSLILLLRCNDVSKSNNDIQKAADTIALQASQSGENSNLDGAKPLVADTVVSRSTDTLAELLSQLKNIPLGDNYKMKGTLKTDILKYTSLSFGDLLHLTFTDKNNKEYDFNGNVSKIELDEASTNPTDENGGYEANKKYLNKNFRVVWRTIKLKNKPKDEMDMYYEEYDEIIYLKQID